MEAGGESTDVLSGRLRKGNIFEVLVTLWGGGIVGDCMLETRET